MVYVCELVDGCDAGTFRLERSSEPNGEDSSMSGYDGPSIVDWGGNHGAANGERSDASIEFQRGIPFIGW